MIDMTLFAQLHISEAGRPDRTITVAATLTIGRDDENDIVLESITVSRCHALLLPDSAGLRLVDLESTNGTLVNGVLAPADEPVRLADGDVVQFGQVLARYAAPPKWFSCRPVEHLACQQQYPRLPAIERSATYKLCARETAATCRC
jgi:pSer/pThr/pTyr-binding forkhead associated (FHA) protein